MCACIVSRTTTGTASVTEVVHISAEILYADINIDSKKIRDIV